MIHNHHHYHHCHSWAYCSVCQVRYCLTCGKEERYYCPEPYYPWTISYKASNSHSHVL